MIAQNQQEMLRRLAVEQEWCWIDNLPPHVVDLKAHQFSVENFADGTMIYRCDGKPFLMMQQPQFFQVQDANGNIQIRAQQAYKRME